MGFQINGGIIDTMIAASLIDENRSYTLDSVGKDYIGMRKNEKLYRTLQKILVSIQKQRCGDCLHHL